MMKNKILFLSCIFLFTLLLDSCKIIKTIKILKKGTITQKNFKEQISFETRAGLIVVKVNIDGKDYNFIFDSGATNCVTKELAAALKLKPVVNQTAEDAEGKKGGIQFAMIKELKMGNISFCNTGAAIIDLLAVPELACLKVDGLIGANQMRKCFWQIDYLKQQLTFASNLDSLKVPASASSFSFKPLLTGTPLVEVELEGVKCDGNIFDTGSSGAVTLSAGSFKKVMKKNPAFKHIRGVGSSSSGLYGAGFDTTYMASTTLKAGTFTAANKVVEFKRDKGNLGSDFFKDYIVTIDWKQNKIWFVPQATESSPWETFGFVALKKQNKLVLTFLFENSPASDAGLNLGDEIVSINEKDFSNLSNEDYCSMIVNQAPWKKENKLLVKFKTKGGMEKTVSLEKRNLLSTK
jgi:hypothetical protein